MRRFHWLSWLPLAAWITCGCAIYGGPDVGEAACGRDTDCPGFDPQADGCCGSNQVCVDGRCVLRSADHPCCHLESGCDPECLPLGCTSNEQCVEDGLPPLPEQGACCGCWAVCTESRCAGLCIDAECCFFGTTCGPGCEALCDQDEDCLEGMACLEGQCASGEAGCGCLARHRADYYGSVEIAGLESILQGCFAGDDPYVLELQAACLPFALGRDARNDLLLEVAYYCSDVCPDYGRVYVRYQGVERPDCEAAGGVPEFDPAWGGYMGCLPPELAHSTFPPF